MPIYLEQKQRDAIRYYLRYARWWVAKKLLSMVEADEARLTTIANCSHTKAIYTGVKSCCGKCGSFYEPGMGVSWNLVNEHSDRGLNRNSRFTEKVTS